MIVEMNTKQYILHFFATITSTSWIVNLQSLKIYGPNNNLVVLILLNSFAIVQRLTPLTSFNGAYLSPSRWLRSRRPSSWTCLVAETWGLENGPQGCADAARTWADVRAYYADLILSIINNAIDLLPTK